MLYCGVSVALMYAICIDAIAVTIPSINQISMSATTTQQEVLGIPSIAMVQATVTESMTVSDSWMSLVTIAPLSRNPLQLRQRCFNDQGFSVNCATWTGYYYTWGGAGHPYAGGPGDGSSGSGTGSNSNGITGIISEANRLRILFVSSVVAFSTLCLLIVL